MEPDAIGAALAQGVVSVESLTDNYNSEEVQQMEEVVSEWKRHTRSHSMAALGDQQSLRQRLQGEIAARTRQSCFKWFQLFSAAMQTEMLTLTDKPCHAGFWASSSLVM